MRTSQLTVLVIDDNIHMLRIIATMVRGFGFDKVLTAQDPADAFEIIKSNQVDLIFLDLRMPVLDGLEFTDMIRNSPDSPDPYVPIIMITAHSERVMVQKARDIGVTEFCCKPINANTLYQRIVSVVNYNRPFIRSATYFGPDRRRRKDPNYKGPERRQADPEPSDAFGADAMT